MGLNHLFRRALNIYHERGIIPLLSVVGKAVRNRLLRSERVYWTVTELRYAKNCVQYDAVPDPYRTIRVDPQRIKCWNKEISIYLGLGQIQSGEWDLWGECISIEDHWIERGLIERFVYRKDWEETIYYKKSAKLISSGKLTNYKNIDEFKRVRCQYVDELFENIKKDGYRPNSEATHNVPEKQIKQGRHHELEPLVAIGRTGKVFFCDGHHRVMLAKIAGVDRIPVNVIARHCEWQSLRDEIHNAEAIDEITLTAIEQLSHPDMADLSKDFIE